jgi:hypothetical protein
LKGILILCLALLTLSATAEELQRVYQPDAYGRIRHDKPSYSVGEDGRIVEVGPYGNKQLSEVEKQRRSVIGQLAQHSAQG